MVHKALSMALRRRRLAPGLVVHSDRGNTFTSFNMRNLLESWKVERSMSRTGDCLDKAVMESFFASLKRESCALRGDYDSLDTAPPAIFQFSEGYYNPKKRHSCLGFCNPDDCEMLIQQAYR
jgi:transposase InsO family protein